MGSLGRFGEPFVKPDSARSSCREIHYWHTVDAPGEGGQPAVVKRKSAKDKAARLAVVDEIRARNQDTRLSEVKKDVAGAPAEGRMKRRRGESGNRKGSPHPSVPLLRG